MTRSQPLMGQLFPATFDLEYTLTDKLINKNGPMGEHRQTAETKRAPVDIWGYLGEPLKTVLGEYQVRVRVRVIKDACDCIIPHSPNLSPIYPCFAGLLNCYL